jgi:hypothetical protein
VRKSLVYATTLVVAFALGLGLAGVLPNDAQAKPTQCLLTIEPFYHCVDHPSCKGEEQRCWWCQGIEPGTGEPCLCTLVGCMVP